MSEILKNVIDPETLSSIVDLGFVKQIEEGENRIRVILSPPTFWCPPTFLYMILEDLREKLKSKYEIINIEVVDHHDSEKLTKCINKGLRFDECYKDEAMKGLYDDLKKRFYQRFERGMSPKNRSDRLVRLSLGITGEMCKLLAEERMKREGS
ncbi:iron-sulfur cluster assembly protein [Sulfurisphaera ohwakuensis]|uniref:iron-sulfur cluster assembly protein n=1 Tax=Sulfurisphaera ohwakuensis TaxID=69656 RepID=UPI0036F396A0